MDRQPSHDNTSIKRLFEDAPEGTLIRAAADGELPPEFASRVSDHAGAIAFERQLCRSVDRVMEGPKCPNEVRERLTAKLAAAVSEDQLDDRLSARSVTTRDRSFWAAGGAAKTLRTVGAIAAVLMLAVAGVYVANLGTTPAGPGGFESQLASFATREHGRVAASPNAAERKLRYRSMEAANAHLSDLFGFSVHMPEPASDAVEFIGCGSCKLPGSGASSHMQFRLPASSEGGEPRVVSLFIGDNPGSLSLEPGVTYAVENEACEAAGASMFVWTDGRLLFTLVAVEDPDGESCREVLSTLRVPPASRSI